MHLLCLLPDVSKIIFESIPRYLLNGTESVELSNAFRASDSRRGTGTGALATVQTLLPSEPGTASILLDNNLSYPAIGNSDDTLWSRIDAVQAVKNNLFLASITPAMRKGFPDMPTLIARVNLN